MKYLEKYKKPVACFFITLMLCQLMIPLRSMALTSGPSQPEMKGFEPIGTSDMVDLFSGDFSYNIPLIDVGGYPVNLSYHSGNGMDDEASWVGYGWNLNPGVVNRQMRGIPDEFNGKDSIERQTNMKDHITKGLSLKFKGEFLGIPGSGEKAKKKLTISPVITVGVQFDNYRGIGTSIGVNPGLSVTTAAAAENNANMQDLAEDMNTQGNNAMNALGAPDGFGIQSSSLDGASLDMPLPNFAILKNKNSATDKTVINSGFSYNGRAGNATLTLGLGTVKKFTDDYGVNRVLRSSLGVNSAISFAGDSYTPFIDMPTNNQAYSLGVDGGGQVQTFYIGGGITGYYSKLSYQQKTRRLPAYGFLNSEKGKNNTNALMDFNREKDVPFFKDLNYLAIPIPTYDIYMASSQDGVGQYRPYRASSGIFFDHSTKGLSTNATLGIELGFGTYFDVGADLHFQAAFNHTQKWNGENDFLSAGDFSDRDINNPAYEHVYFKRVGEPTPIDNQYYNTVLNNKAFGVVLDKTLKQTALGAKATGVIRTKNGNAGSINFKRTKREIKNQNFNFLTASEAANHGLEKYIKSYPDNFDSLYLGNCPAPTVQVIPRSGGYRKAHHPSEITITGDDAKRMVYGIPIYNTYQEEVSFSVDPDLSKRKRGMIAYNHGSDNSLNNTKGRENYYSKDIMPPYATSYLLTGILSPDYIDVKGDGITDDDIGTAVKFNYNKSPNLYQWRTPVDSANYNEGLLSDNRDDKANYVFGKREQWYLYSIESKTMVAQFVTEDRDDGLGVINSDGGKDVTNKTKRLKEIRLYSKSDIKAAGGNMGLVTPIKVVHFEYSYSMMKGIPNQKDGLGKLILRKVYFTFGKNSKGILHPYSFGYDTTGNYMPRQYDRWGNYKNADDNPSGLNNSEFPYTLQDRTKTDVYAAKFQLNQIGLPSGGSIHVTYESDDYGYVQDKRAAQMCFVKGINTSGGSSGLIKATDLLVDLPVGVTSDKELKWRYFQDMEYLYFKCFVDLDNLGHKEFVSGYGHIKNIHLENSTTARITLEKIDNVNPIASASWQFLRMNLPKYAFPGYDNFEDNGSDFGKAIKSLVNAIGNIKELLPNAFLKKAVRRGFGDNIELNKSWVRLCSPTLGKLGGGCRVKTIEINDDWANMSGATNSTAATYKQQYQYTTTVKDMNGNDLEISSGVASYEPMMGGEENPWRQPAFYKQKQFLQLSNYFYLEQPFGESLFPSPTVGYSKVTVKSIGSGDTDSKTGLTTSEFYTAKDYPTKVEALGIDKKIPALSKILQILKVKIVDHVGLSQGYEVETNDMHGKPKSTVVLNNAGNIISSVEYSYKNASNFSVKKELDNSAKLIMPDGKVQDGMIGIDVDMFTDMREQTTSNIGTKINLSGGAAAAFIFPIPFLFPGGGLNFEYRSFRSSSTIKYVNRFAILDKVKKTENGSSITTQNLLWDGVTGDVLLTKSQNEFDDPVYNFTYPAHWVYDGMGMAYKNLGTYLNGFTTASNGSITNSLYTSLLTPGDELIDISSANKYWVISSVDGSNTSALRLIDTAGNLAPVNNMYAKILRSGRRNMAGASIATLVSLNNPIVGDMLDVSSMTKILDAKTTVFNQEWNMPFYCSQCPDGYVRSSDGNFCIKDTVPSVSGGCFTVCEGSHDASYSYQGTFIYAPGYNVDGTGVVAGSITSGNQLWVGGTCYSEQTRSSQQSRIPSPDSAWNAPNSLVSPQISVPADTSTCTIDPSAPWNTTYCGPLHRCGIWTCRGIANGNRNPVSEWLGFSRCMNVTNTKTYYLGIAGDNQVRFYVDGVLKFDLEDCSTGSPFHEWRIFPIDLAQGNHIIQMEGYNCGGPASFGAEIYDNTFSQLMSATTLSDLNIIFSTRNMVGQAFDIGHYSCPTGYNLNTCDSVFSCRSFFPLSQIFNPYLTGVLGNWRPKESYVFHINREQDLSGDPTVFGGTDIRKAGAYKTFIPFWTYNYSMSAFSRNSLVNDTNWVWSNQMLYYNTKGQEVETRDALNRYSSALFGYLESLPVAVASNARHNEIAFDAFEDYNFNLECINYSSCDKGHFNFKGIPGCNISNAQAHSGKNSLSLTGGTVTIKKSTGVASFNPTAPYTWDPSGMYLQSGSELAKGFSPVPGKKYVLSLWVKDGAPRDATTTLDIKINGTALLNSSMKWPVVEGWKRVELSFLFPASATEFRLDITPVGGNVFIDDIRLHPYDGQMKTFAYDNSSQRLWAEMDENNLATFYEYDDEGILIRVKKETERGIMTIKETRSSNRRQQ